MSSKDLVLVTGGTGSVGFTCVIHSLKAGFRVRTTVRRESAIDEIKAAVQPYLKDVEIVVVNDMTKEDAFLEALQGVKYVLHVASPLAGKTESLDEEHMITPAILGTTSILASALKVPSIKRVVITSSIAAVRGQDEDKIYNETTVNPKLTRPYGPYENPMVAYRDFKILAFHATKEFIATHRPAYTVINLLPTFILGRHELAKSSQALASGSNALLLGNILGRTAPGPVVPMTVHVEDVARVHVEALTTTKIGPGGGDFIVHGSTVVWDDALEIVKRHFPKAVEKGILPLGGTTPSQKALVDGSKAEEVFGRMKGFEEQVVSLVGQYVELATKA